jgi:hypothetical protein
MKENSDNRKFAKDYAQVDSKDKAKNSPWEYEAPLKPRPKQFDVNDPDNIGG